MLNIFAATGYAMPMLQKENKSRDIVKIKHACLSQKKVIHYKKRNPFVYCTKK